MTSTPTSQPLLATLRTFPPGVWFLFLGSFINKFGSFVMPFITFYMTDRGFQLRQVGLVIGAYGVGNLISAVWGGHLADTIGRRKTIVVSMFLGAIGMISMSFANGLGSLLALTFLVGMSGEMYRPAASALLIDLVPPHQHPTAFAAYRVAFNAGWMFGPATAGFLAAYGYHWLFFGDALTSFLFGVVAWFALPKGILAKHAQQSWRVAWQSIRHDRVYHLILLSMLGPAIIIFQVHSGFSAHLNNLGFSPRTYGWLVSYNGLLILLFELPIAQVTQRFAIRRMIAFGFILFGVGYSFSGMGASLWIFVVSMTILTLGEMIAFPLLSTSIAKIAPPEMRGRYMGLNGCVWSFATIIGPYIGLTIYEQHVPAYWLFCLALGLFAAAIISIRPKGASF